MYYVSKQAFDGESQSFDCEHEQLDRPRFPHSIIGNRGLNLVTVLVRSDSKHLVGQRVDGDLPEFHIEETLPAAVTCEPGNNPVTIQHEPKGIYKILSSLKCKARKKFRRAAYREYASKKLFASIRFADCLPTPLPQRSS